MTRDFLFAISDAGGNVPPTLGAARRLLARGHRVRVLGDESIRHAVSKAGGRFLPWCLAPNRRDHSTDSDVMRDWEESGPMGGLARLRDRMMVGPAALHAADVLAAIDAEAVDAVVSSDLMFGPMIAAEAAQVPLAVLAANLCYLPIPGIPPFGPGVPPAKTPEEHAQAAGMQAGMREFLNAALPVLNEARAGLRLSPLGDVLMQPALADRFLLATCPEFDFPAERMPSFIRYVGPILDTPDWTKCWTSDWPWADMRPLVLVAFSTTFQGQAPAIQRTLDALATLPVRAVVTLGPALDTIRFRAPPGAIVIAQASHDEILAHASAVVTHGGHGTVMRALGHGVPVMCMPMGRDQNDNAIRLQVHGAGLRLTADAGAEEIGRALRRILMEPSFRQQAARLGGAVAAWGLSTVLEDELEGVASRPRLARCA